MQPKFNGVTSGEFYDPTHSESASITYARMQYFNVVCVMKVGVARSLIDIFHKNINVVHSGLAWWPALTSYASFPDDGISTYPSAELNALVDDLEHWSKAYELEDLEDWVFDLALSTFQQWYLYPKIPLTAHKISTDIKLPLGYWWSMGAPQWRAYPHSQFSYEPVGFHLVNFLEWEKEQDDKHGKFSGPRGVRDPIPTLTYNNLHETRKRAERRIESTYKHHIRTYTEKMPQGKRDLAKAFKQQLSAYLDGQDAEAEVRGYIRVKSLAKRCRYRHVLIPYFWLYHRHFDKWGNEKIAIAYTDGLRETVKPLISQEVWAQLFESDSGVDESDSEGDTAEDLSLQAISAQTVDLARRIGLRL